MVTTNCTSCRWTYEQYKEDGHEVSPPCETCYPGVHDYNKPILKVYQHCSSQLRVGMSGAFAIDLNAVDLILESFDVAKEERLDFYDGVSHLSSLVIKSQADQSKNTKKK